jgi:MOSC domain-containing protein YiiM
MRAMWEGHVVSLHVALRAGAPLEVLPEVRAIPGRGLEGDRYFLGQGHYSGRPSPGGREVTLIEMETLEALEHGILNSGGDKLGLKITAAESRRNIATAGVPLNHLLDRAFWVGSVQMRGTRLCEPCQYLEDLTRRPGILGGLVHRGGLRAQILNEGLIRTGDVIRPA